MVQNNTETFHSRMMGLRPKSKRYEAFYDFLDLTLWSLSHDLLGEPNLDTLNMELVRRYTSEDFEAFRELLPVLVQQMDVLMAKGRNQDILGRFYAKHLAMEPIKEAFSGRKWTPAEVPTLEIELQSRTYRCFIDEDCGSGQRLLAARAIFGPDHYYLGIDHDPLCVMMCAFNLLVTKCRGEVICGSPQEPHYFVFGYRVSRNPLRLQKIQHTEDSLLWETYLRSK